MCKCIPLGLTEDWEGEIVVPQAQFTVRDDPRACVQQSTDKDPLAWLDLTLCACVCLYEFIVSFFHVLCL